MIDALLFLDFLTTNEPKIPRLHNSLSGELILPDLSRSWSPSIGMPINQEPKILSKFDVSTSSVPVIGHHYNSGSPKLCLLAYPI